MTTIPIAQQFSPDLEQTATSMSGSNLPRPELKVRSAQKALIICIYMAGEVLRKLLNLSTGLGLRHGSSTTGWLVPAAVTAVTANANARASVGLSVSDAWCTSVSEQTQQLEGSMKGYPRRTSCRSSSSESTDFAEAHTASTNFTVVTANATSA